MTGTRRGTGALALWLAAEAPSTLRALRLDTPRLEKLASRRIAWTLVSASRTPFGRERLRRGGLDIRALQAGAIDPGLALRSLAPVSKAELREAGHAALEGGRPKPQWRSSCSSGSTGEPFRVYYDTRAWALLKHLVKLRARVVCGVRPWHRVALVDAFPLRAGRDGLRAGSGSALRGGWPRRVLRLNALEDPRGAAANLVDFRPRAIYGLPSALLEIAAALEAPLAPPPLRVFTSGELLDSGTRRSLQTAFGATVLDVYGSSETKEIAWECPRGGKHVNADVIRVEVLDRGGGALPAGAEGEIIATLLVSRAMPLLRYRTGDRGALLPEPCPCGVRLPLLGIVAGREADVLELAGGRRLSPYALTCALERVPGMLRYQVVQLGPSVLSVRARVRPEVRASAGAVIREAVRRAAGPGVVVQVAFVEAFERGAGGKFRVVLPAGERRAQARPIRSEEAS